MNTNTIKYTGTTCHDLPYKLATILAYLEKPAEIAIHFSSRSIYLTWWHILTCVFCKEKIRKQGWDKQYPEFMLYPHEHDLWKLPYYLLSQNELSQKQIANITETSENILNNLCFKRDLKKIEKYIETKNVFEFWTKIIKNDWDRNAILLQLFNGSNCAYKLPSLEACGDVRQKISPEIFFKPAFDELENLSLHTEWNPSANEFIMRLQGLRESQSAMAKIILHYKDSSCEDFETQEAITLSSKKIENIDSIQIFYRYRFTIDKECEEYLNQKELTEKIRLEFEKNRIFLSDNINIEYKEKEIQWIIKDRKIEQQYCIKREKGLFKVYREIYI